MQPNSEVVIDRWIPCQHGVSGAYWCCTVERIVKMRNRRTRVGVKRQPVKLLRYDKRSLYWRAWWLHRTRNGAVVRPRKVASPEAQAVMANERERLRASQAVNLGRRTARGTYGQTGAESQNLRP